MIGSTNEWRCEHTNFIIKGAMPWAKIWPEIRGMKAKPILDVHYSQSPLCIFFLLLLFGFLGQHLQHMEVRRLRAESELQLLIYTTATATPDPSHVCNLHHSSQQRRIRNPLSKGRDRTRNLVVPSQIHQPLSHDGNSPAAFLDGYTLVDLPLSPTMVILWVCITQFSH